MRFSEIHQAINCGIFVNLLLRYRGLLHAAWIKVPEGVKNNTIAEHIHKHIVDYKQRHCMLVTSALVCDLGLIKPHKVRCQKVFLKYDSWCHSEMVTCQVSFDTYSMGPAQYSQRAPVA